MILAADSLRSRLIRALLMPLLLALAAAAAGAYNLVLRPALQAYDQALGDAAVALIPYVGLHGDVDAAHLSLDLPPAAERILRNDEVDELFFAVRHADGRWIGGDEALDRLVPVNLARLSGVAPASRDRPPAAAPPSTSTRQIGRLPSDRVFLDARFHDQPVRVIAQQAQVAGLPVQVLVAETTRKRERAMFEISTGLFAPLAAFALMAVAVVAAATARGLRPLARLSEDLKMRSPERLDPIEVQDAAAEIRPVVSSLNDLLERLGQAQGAQRRFLADAAHQLRTPLAGLSVILGLARDARDPDSQRERLAQALQATQRTARLANQFLALSAVEPGGRDATLKARINLADAIGGMGGDWVPKAMDKDIDLGFELHAVEVAADEVLLLEAVRNLIDNALTYCPPGSRITVRCGQRPPPAGIALPSGVAFIEVEDDGPGIPEAERHRVIDRFYRLPGTPGIGSGLGLAIVEEIAKRCGGLFMLGDSQVHRTERPGLRATIELPVWAADLQGTSPAGAAASNPMVNPLASTPSNATSPTGASQAADGEAGPGR